MNRNNNNTVNSQSSDWIFPTKKPEILIVSTYPPRECGIANYTFDLVKALNNKFDQSFKIKICALETNHESHTYSDKIECVLNTDRPADFNTLTQNINQSDELKMVIFQHEFGFYHHCESDFMFLIHAIEKPLIFVFHTVLPKPDENLKLKVQQICAVSQAIIVMTNFSAEVLLNDYEIEIELIHVIPHGTHLVKHLDKIELKAKFKFDDRLILSTFGLLSSGKSIETTLKGLPAIIDQFPEVLFLIIGKTHPTVVKQEGEKYREMLERIIGKLELQNHVKFINAFVPLPELLEYLQMTDIYLFTSNDPNQAVSGTFSYGMSCGCPIVSTPIPHAKEVLLDGGGIIIDFGNSDQLSAAVCKLLKDENQRKEIRIKGLQRIAATAWENSAIQHALLFEKISHDSIELIYNLPKLNLDHIKKMTTPKGIIQFSIVNQPDIDTGYTLDDNARAMIAICQHYELTSDETNLAMIETYLDFIEFCYHSEGYFLNYVDEDFLFTDQNYNTNLADSNGRAIWALGYLISMHNILPEKYIHKAEVIFEAALKNVHKIHSTRAMAFVIKGLYYQHKKFSFTANIKLMRDLADRLVAMYMHEADEDWHWFESYLTYANSILPEALLCAWKISGFQKYEEIAKLSFDFLLSKTMKNGRIKVISNRGWLHRGKENIQVLDGGEQPIDVAYCIMALSLFHEVYKSTEYEQYMKMSFNWFLGQNHLHQIIYNPETGGCYDGLEEKNINLNQGAESTVSYLMARLTMEKTFYANKKNQFLSSSKYKSVG